MKRLLAWAAPAALLAGLAAAIPGAGPRPGGDFQHLKLEADDLAQVTGVNVYKFRVAMPRGQRFRVALREVRAEGAEPRVLHQQPFVKGSDEPVTVRVGFLRADRKLAGFLLSEEKEAEYRVDCSGCTPGGFATVVPLPLADVPPTGKTLMVSGSQEMAAAPGLKGVRLLAVAASGPATGARPSNLPRAELVLEYE